jgi:hypothetical protein
VLSARNAGAFALIAALLGASIIVVALLLRLVLRGRQDADSLESPSGRVSRRIAELLRFATGPFPISIGLHVAVLLYLLAKVIVPTALPPTMVRLETDGGGGGGNQQLLKLPELPDAAMVETAPPELESPPQISLPRLPPMPRGPSHSNDYVRSASRGGFGSGTGGGFGTGAGGGIGSGYGPGLGPGFGEFIKKVRSKGLDVVLVIDGTGSMRFVIDDVKTRMKALVLALHRLVPTARIAIVVFGGGGERIATAPFTLSLPQLGAFLSGIKAENGGEWYEDTPAAIRAAVDQMAWRTGAKKVIVLVGDTPPLPEDDPNILHLIDKFHGEDGTFNTVDVTAEEHERFARAFYFSAHHRYPDAVPPLWEFDQQTQRAYREMARVGGGEWSSLTKDPEVNQQVLILAFGRRWESQAAAVVPPAVGPSHQDAREVR